MEPLNSEKETILARINALEKLELSSQREVNVYSKGKYKNHSNKLHADLMISTAQKELKELYQKLNELNASE